MVSIDNWKCKDSFQRKDVSIVRTGGIIFSIGHRASLYSILYCAIVVTIIGGGNDDCDSAEVRRLHFLFGFESPPPAGPDATLSSHPGSRIRLSGPNATSYLLRDSLCCSPRNRFPIGLQSGHRGGFNDRLELMATRLDVSEVLLKASTRWILPILVLSSFK